MKAYMFASDVDISILKDGKHRPGLFLKLVLSSPFLDV